MAYIVIDEGYERQWGIWEAGWKFEEGLSAVCDQIRSSGYEPGIWTAPLMVNVYTPLYREHPDWFAGDEQGNVYLEDTAYGVMAQLDITQPEVETHIRQTYEHLSSAGFTYFKCDFAQLLLGASTFYRNDMSHAGMIRRLFEVIRETIGAESYLLACGAPYEAVIGVADAHRTTGDIHNYWSHIRQNIRSMFGRGWMQGSIGNTDPDTAIVRCKETTDDKQLNRRSKRKPWSAGANWTSGRKMSLTEAKTLLLACYVTGGDLILGDALMKLNPLGTELLACLLGAPVQSGMIPLNLFEPDGDEMPIVLTESGGENYSCCSISATIIERKPSLRNVRQSRTYGRSSGPGMLCRHRVPERSSWLRGARLRGGWCEGRRLVMKGYLALLGAVSIWAVSYIVMKTATTDYPQLLFQFWRYAAVAVVYFLCFYRSVKAISGSIWKKGLLRLGLANFVLGFFSIYAVQYTTPTRVVVINSLIIGIVPLLRWIHDRCRLARGEIWSVGIALTAIALLIGPEDHAVRLGDGLAFAGMLGSAYSIVLTSRLLSLHRASVIQVSFLGVAGCAVYFTLAAIVYACFTPGGFALPSLLSQPGTVAGILYMILFVSVAANLLQVFGQRRLPPVTVSILFCLEPALTAVLDYLVLGHALSIRVMISGVLLITATIIAATYSGKEAWKRKKSESGEWALTDSL
ncbi:EamA family transporter [Paenibacillus sp. CC-CFT747]|nr:EamA family transporter [Paenibacillus sp. CC-CFT747]